MTNFILLLAKHPLPWKQAGLTILDAKDREVAHLGGCTSPRDGSELSALIEFIIAAVNGQFVYAISYEITDVRLKADKFDRIMQAVDEYKGASVKAAFGKTK